MNIFLSKLENSSVSIFGHCLSHFSSDPKILELLLASLEINRQLIAGFTAVWESEEEMFAQIQSLIHSQKTLELELSEFLRKE